MTNNPNTPQAPKKGLFRKALDAVLGSDSDSIAEMKRLNKKAEVEGGFDPKTIKEKRAYEELLEKEAAAEKKKRHDEMSASAKTRDGAKSAFVSSIKEKITGKDKDGTGKSSEETNESGSPENVVKGGLLPFKAILAEDGNKELRENIYSLAALISLIRNHKLMQSKGRGEKFKSILTQKGYEFLVR